MNFFRNITIILLLLALSIGGFAASSSGYGDDGVVVTPQQINLGEVSTTQVNSFWVVNNSKAPVLITDVEVDCSCTKAKFQKQPIMAGDSLEVEVRYMPRKDDKGVFYKTIKFYTTHSDEPIKAIIRGKNI